MTPGSRRHRLPAVLVATTLAAMLSISACSDAVQPTSEPVGSGSIDTPASGVPATSAAAPASPLTGVLTAIQATGLTQVTGFTLRLDDGSTVTFRIGTLENGAQFPPGHLAEHLATSSPVRVFFRVEGSDLVVYRLEDAS